MSSDANRNGSDRFIVLLAAIMTGGFLGSFAVPPFPYLAKGARATALLAAETWRERPEILEPAVYPGKGVITRQAGKVSPGNTLIQGIFPGGTQVRLYNDTGRELHRWTADFLKVWPDAKEHFPPERIPKTTMNYLIQGMWPLRDGSIVLNFSELGAVRLDRCSRVMWRSDRITHHSVTPTADGDFWIPGQISIFETPKRFLPTGLTAQDIHTRLGDRLKGYNNSILLVDANGRAKKEFSVLKAVYEAGLDYAIYTSLAEEVTDPTHLNDIEVVTPELATRIEGTQPGDLLVSLREMSMLAVLDKDDGHLKWYRQGPWLRQHDVDITPEGKIEVFNNRSKKIGGFVESSQILSFDPATNSIEILFPVGEDDRFYTRIMGTHQKLDNGNRLITESVAGRVFEVMPTGDVVWDFRMPYDGEAASLLSNAMRVPEDYFTKDIPTCSTDT